jgi:hypothetical protein
MQRVCSGGTQRVFQHVTVRSAHLRTLVRGAEVLRGPEHRPGTAEGLERSRRSRWKHGHYSAEAKRVRREARQQYRLLRRRPPVSAPRARENACGNEWSDVRPQLASQEGPGCTSRLFAFVLHSTVRSRSACAGGAHAAAGVHRADWRRRVARCYLGPKL